MLGRLWIGEKRGRIGSRASISHPVGSTKSTESSSILLLPSYLPSDFSNEV